MNEPGNFHLQTSCSQVINKFNFHVSNIPKPDFFKQNIRWRKERKMAEINRDDFADIAADFPYSSDGYDKEGRPGICFVVV